MIFDGSEDCPGQQCLANLDLADFKCGELIDEAWVTRLNNNFLLVAQALCCVANSIPSAVSVFNFIPLTTVFSDSAEQLVEGNLPFTTEVNVPASVPADYNGLILRVYFELDNQNNDISTIQLSLTINDQVMGTVEHGGQNVTDDSFWNGDFFLPPNPSDPTKIKINPTIDFNSAGDPDGDVYAVVVKVVGYF